MSVMNTPDLAASPLPSRRGVPAEPSSAVALLLPPAGLPRVLDVELPRLRLVRLLEDEIPPGSPGADLLREIVRTLPQRQALAACCG